MIRYDNALVFIKAVLLLCIVEPISQLCQSCHNMKIVKLPTYQQVMILSIVASVLLSAWCSFSVVMRCSMFLLVFQVTFEQNVTQTAHSDQFSSALINVSLSDTSARNNEHRLHRCSGTVCAVWRVESFAQTVAKLFPTSADWCFCSDLQQSLDGNQDRCTKKTADSAADKMLFLLPCFALISVGDALSRFSSFSSENCW